MSSSEAQSATTEESPSNGSAESTSQQDQPHEGTGIASKLSDSLKSLVVKANAIFKYSEGDQKAAENETKDTANSNSKSTATKKPPPENWKPIPRGTAVSDLPGTAMKRIAKDLMEIQNDPIEGAFVCHDDGDISRVDVLVMGPHDTPYEGGFFWFYVSFPKSYPYEPPKVKMMNTTGVEDGKSIYIRFNPNIYCDGKVCLSILGTWEGAPWTSVMSLRSLIISIMSLLGENPICNEPGLEETPIDSQDARRYNSYVTYCTLKFAALRFISRIGSAPIDILRLIAMMMEEELPHYRALAKRAKAVWDTHANTGSSQNCTSDRLFGRYQEQVVYDWDGLIASFSSDAIKKQLRDISNQNSDELHQS